MNASMSAQSMELPKGMAHLWYVSAAQTRIPFDYHLSLLDEEERQHAARFHFQGNREQFVLARSSLRLLMARYTGFAPAQIRFKKNQYGKLYLQYPNSPVQFNITHSGSCTILAIACGAEIGVDAEVIRDSGLLVSISSYFTRGEQVWLNAVAHDERDEAFFRLWTCKEAYVKVLGRGLSKSLHSFEVSFVNSEPKIVFDLDNHAAANSWWLLLFKPDRNITGCVAVQTSVETIEWRDYGSDLLQVTF